MGGASWLNPHPPPPDANAHNHNYTHNHRDGPHHTTDLTDKIRRLALKHEKERGEASTAAAAATDVVSPRTYRFKRVTPMELLRQQEERRRRQQQEQVTASSARRVLLPAVQTEDEASVGADLEGRSRGRVLGGEGLVLFVDDDSKVRD